MNRRAALGAAACLALRPAWAQNYPSSAVKFIVPYAPGGGLDVVARYLAQGMSAQLGQTFVVDNRAGGGGMLGAGVVTKAAPDGYTLLMAGNPELTITPYVLGMTAYSAIDEFTPVDLIAQSPNVFVTSPSTGIKSMRAALELAQQNGKGLSVGTPGNGSPQHIALEVLRSQTSKAIVHVPYRGAAPATVAALSGEVSLALVGSPPVMPHIQSGKLHALAITQTRRSPLLRDVPTMSEAVNLMGDQDFVTWYGLMAPKRTPAEIVQKLEKTLSDLLASTGVQARLTALGTDTVNTTGAAFVNRLTKEAQFYANVVKRFGITAS